MSMPLPLAALPREIRAHLGDELEIDLSATLRRDIDADAQGVTFFTAEILWRYPLGYGIEGDLGRSQDEEVLSWARSHGVTVADGDQDVTIPIGRVQLATISRNAANGFDQLDSIDGNYAALGAVLFLGTDGREPYAESVDGVGSLALLVDDVEIARPFRGHGISVAALDMLLTHFEASCGCALLEPEDRDAQIAASDDGRDSEDREPARGQRERMMRHWAKLGFEDYGDGIMVIDLGMTRPFHPGDRGLQSV